MGDEPWKINELTFSEMSDLTSRAYSCRYTSHQASVLILEFAGQYRYGSDGNRDAAYMEATPPHLQPPSRRAS